MSEEWKQWKVGDKLRSINGWGADVCKGDIVEIIAILNSCINTIEFKLKHASGKHTYIYDNGPSSNPSTYFILQPTYKVGDRAQRSDTHPHQLVHAGTLGYIYEVTDRISILWDCGRRAQYTLDQYGILFTLIPTGQISKQVLCCSRCYEYNEWAEANQSDGSYRCYQCRKDRFR